MSTIRDPAYITDAGRTMMTAGGDVTYTKAVLYGQDISHLTSDQVKALTTIGNPLKEVKVGISDKQNTDRGTTVILEATFQNDNLKADLPYSAVGFFAQKVNDEKLIAVAVANAGAYLTATSPDGVATDALDLKLAIAIGDATNVTATVDPAGSVTPATLNGAINKATHDLTAKIDTKADKTTVESELAIKANSTDVDKKLDTKANYSDVYTKKQVDDAFSSRDATIATKADKATVDAEIGKIDFTPYAKTVDVDSKVKTVTDLANTKDSTADVDAKIKAVTDKVNTKADQSNVNNQVQDAKNAATSRADNLQSQVNNLKGARTANSPDFDSLTDSGPYYVTTPEKGKNSPCGGIWGTLIISNGADHRIVQTYYPDNDDSPFYRMKVDNNWQPWRQMAKMSDISYLQNLINTKQNIATPLFREIQNSNSWQDIFGVGNPNSVLTSIRIDAGGSGPLLNDFAAGVGFGGADTKGVLSVGYHNNQARITGGNGNGPVWSEDIAWKSDINSLLNTISTLQNQVNDLINQINYIKDNYIEGRRFPASQEAQAQAWENEKPTRIAMIEK
ncbi:pyocin knob domain-containing protein [Lactobacillus crispatus]|uniref:Phage tail protein n=1 Tax=Lactobacillus crispatus TaxID=47770 RepID=A0A6A1Z968_9LACO|nr:pyocin knob domain-containing protein [Lactobacillus crispatus]KAB1978259.1 hypothetical protein F8251_00730 [Lactobacillus crispatus]MCT3537772.1 hypothetical protein [Lactobacillus crispatus]